MHRRPLPPTALRIRAAAAWRYPAAAGGIRARRALCSLQLQHHRGSGTWRWPQKPWKNISVARGYGTITARGPERRSARPTRCFSRSRGLRPDCGSWIGPIMPRPSRYLSAANRCGTFEFKDVLITASVSAAFSCGIIAVYLVGDRQTMPAEHLRSSKLRVHCGFVPFPIVRAIPPSPPPQLMTAAALRCDLSTERGGGQPPVAPRRPPWHHCGSSMAVKPSGRST